MLSVTVWPLGGEEVTFDAVEYLSFVNSGTYGIPAVLGPGPGKIDGARNVLYVNTGSVLAVEADRQA